MARARNAPQRWLYGPGPDLLLGCGLLYAVFFAVFLAVGPSVRAAQPGILFPLLMLLLSTPHYGATLIRVYEHAEDRHAYAFFTVWVTIALCAVFAAGVYVPWVGTAMLTLYLTWSPWHYTGQNFGIAMMFLRRREIDVPPYARRWLHASFVLSFLLLFFVMHGREDPGAPLASRYANANVHLAYLGIPESITQVAVPLLALAYLVSVAGTAVSLLRIAPARALLPVAALVLSQALWFSIPEAAHYWNLDAGLEVLDIDHRTYYFSWIVFAHAIQYLWITAYYARAKRGAERGWQGEAGHFGKALLAGNAAWMVPALLLTPDGIGALSYDIGLGLLVASLVNLHHFILDGAIWKLRSSRVANVLIRSSPPIEVATAGPLDGRRAWGPALVWGIAALLLLGAAVELYDSQIALPRSFAREDYDAASRSLDRMAWLAKDSPQARTRIGRQLYTAGQADLALAELERSVALQPGVEAYSGIGRIHADAGRWNEAARAFDAALAIDPETAALQSLAGLAHLSKGDVDLARVRFERALAIDPEEQRARWGLAELERRGG